MCLFYLFVNVLWVCACVYLRMCVWVYGLILMKLYYLAYSCGDTTCLTGFLSLSKIFIFILFIISWIYIKKSLSIFVIFTISSNYALCTLEILLSLTKLSVFIIWQRLLAFIIKYIVAVLYNKADYYECVISYYYYHCMSIPLSVPQ